ncbi:Uncharacterised protein [Vibrio cholerae]|nr:Uncharacterised protein [Vibrio cholerae]CSC83977.1 Uncharacterised protein [Vibrio cholerae]
MHRDSLPLVTYNSESWYPYHHQSVGYVVSIAVRVVVLLLFPQYRLIPYAFATSYHTKFRNLDV